MKEGLKKFMVNDLSTNGMPAITWCYWPGMMKWIIIGRGWETTSVIEHVLPSTERNSPSKVSKARRKFQWRQALLDGSDDQSQSFLIARHSNKKPHELAAKMILPRHPKLVHPDGEDPVCGMTKMAVLMPQFRGPKGEWMAAGPVSPL